MPLRKRANGRNISGMTTPFMWRLAAAMGGFLRKNAEAYPDVNFIGIERQEIGCGNGGKARG